MPKRKKEKKKKPKHVRTSGTAGELNLELETKFGILRCCCRSECLKEELVPVSPTTPPPPDESTRSDGLVEVHL